MFKMDKLTLIPCEDGSCCCVSNRSTVILISLLSLAMGFIDMLTREEDTDYNVVLEYVDSIRQLLLTVFQMANTLLLLGSMVESTFLVQIYILYVLGFVIMGLVVSLLNFLLKVRLEILWTSINFISEVAFLFVIFQCLPLVDLYRKRVEGK